MLKYETVQGIECIDWGFKIDMALKRKLTQKEKDFLYDMSIKLKELIECEDLSHRGPGPMEMFIKLTDQWDQPVLLNIDWIHSIRIEDDYLAIIFDEGDKILVQETFEEVCPVISNTVGVRIVAQRGVT